MGRSRLRGGIGYNPGGPRCTQVVAGSGGEEGWEEGWDGMGGGERRGAVGEESAEALTLPPSLLFRSSSRSHDPVTGSKVRHNCPAQPSLPLPPPRPCFMVQVMSVVGGTPAPLDHPPPAPPSTCFRSCQWWAARRSPSRTSLSLSNSAAPPGHTTTRASSTTGGGGVSSKGRRGGLRGGGGVISGTSWTHEHKGFFYNR